MRILNDYVIEKFHYREDIVSEREEQGKQLISEIRNFRIFSLALNKKIFKNSIAQKFKCEPCEQLNLVTQTKYIITILIRAEILLFKNI